MEPQLRDFCILTGQLAHSDPDFSLIPDANRYDLQIELGTILKNLTEYNYSLGLFGFSGLRFARQEGYYNILDPYGIITGGLSLRDGDELMALSKAPNAHEYELLEGSESYTLLHQGKRVKVY